MRGTIRSSTSAAAIGGARLGGVARRWREALDGVTPVKVEEDRDCADARRRPVWSKLSAGVPASKVAGTDLGCRGRPRVDATIVIAHSEKENAAATFTRIGSGTPRT